MKFLFLLLTVLVSSKAFALSPDTKLECIGLITHGIHGTGEEIDPGFSMGNRFAVTMTLAEIDSKPNQHGAGILRKTEKLPTRTTNWPDYKIVLTAFHLKDSNFVSFIPELRSAKTGETLATAEAASVNVVDDIIGSWVLHSVEPRNILIAKNQDQPGLVSTAFREGHIPSGIIIRVTGQCSVAR